MLVTPKGTEVKMVSAFQPKRAVMKRTIKKFRLSVSFAKGKITLRRDSEEHRTEAESKSSTALTAIDTLLTMKDFIVCVIANLKLLPLLTYIFQTYLAGRSEITFVGIGIIMLLILLYLTGADAMF